MLGMSPYGLTLAFAIFVAYLFTAVRAKGRGLSAEIVWDSLPWVLFFGIAGARAYHVLNYWSYYSHNFLLIPQVWLGGLGILGGLGGGLLGLLIYFFKFKKDPSLRTAQDDGGGLFRISNYLDAAAPAIILGQALGRVGNILNRENLPYAWWEIILDIFIFLLLLFFEQIKNKQTGKRIFNFQFSIFNKFRNVSMFKLYLFLYCLGRFGLEFLRHDSPWILGPLSVAQWVCLGVIIGILFKALFYGVVAIIRSRIWLH